MSGELPPLDTPPSAPEDGPPKKKGSIVWTLLKLAFAAGIVTFLVLKGAIVPSEVAGAFRTPTWFLEALLLVFACIVIITERWRLLLRIEGIELSFKDAFKLTIVGQFFNNVLPGSVTGDLVKMYYIGRKNPELRAEAWATVMIDRVVGLAALVYLAWASALVNMDFVYAPGRGPLVLTFYGMCTAVAGFTGVILFLALGVGRKSGFADRVRSRLPESVRRGYRAFIRLGERKMTLLASFLLGVLSHTLLVIIGMKIGQDALGDTDLSWKSYFFVVPVGLFVNSVPIPVPGGIGVGEGAFAKLFEWAGATIKGGNVMALFRVTQFAWGLVGALVYAFDRRALAPVQDTDGKAAELLARTRPPSQVS
ncbi:flippase-like domain-containing protein [bacterium]|nr:flippase-like domain-containing protein [bacterium]